jgi:cytochrome c2
MRSRKLFWICIVSVSLIALYFSFRYFVSTITELPAGDSLNNIIRSDTENIARGKILFDAKCRFCHNAYNTETIAGPGLQGILKKPELPVSRRPATSDDVRSQLRQPFSRMPSFDYLTDKEVEDIIAFLNTL